MKDADGPAAFDTPDPLNEAELRPERRAAAPAPITLGPIRLERPEPAAPPSSGAAASATSGVAVAERLAAAPRRRDVREPREVREPGESREPREARAPRDPMRRPAAVPAATSELPLFVRGLQNAPIETPTSLDDQAVTVPPAPAPLSVRRSTPDPAQMRQKYQAPEAAWHKPVSDLIRPVERRDAKPLDQTAGADRDLLQMLDRPDPVAPPAASAAPTPMPEPKLGTGEIPALERLIAALVDGMLLAGINTGVLWFTLRICGLQFTSLGTLPILPLFAFLLLVDAGYLLLFTAASGQTVGKMAAGIRVVAGGPEVVTTDRLTLSQAALRTALTFPSVLVFGAGFVPGLMGDGRALHDRVADTRVVRA